MVTKGTLFSLHIRISAQRIYWDLVFHLHISRYVQPWCFMIRTPWISHWSQPINIFLRIYISYTLILSKSLAKSGGTFRSFLAGWFPFQLCIKCLSFFLQKCRRSSCPRPGHVYQRVGVPLTASRLLYHQAISLRMLNSSIAALNPSLPTTFRLDDKLFSFWHYNPIVILVPLKASSASKPESKTATSAQILGVSWNVKFFPSVSDNPKCLQRTSLRKASRMSQIPSLPTGPVESRPLVWSVWSFRTAVLHLDDGCSGQLSLGRCSTLPWSLCRGRRSTWRRWRRIGMSSRRGSRNVLPSAVRTSRAGCAGRYGDPVGWACLRARWGGWWESGELRWVEYRCAPISTELFDRLEVRALRMAGRVRRLGILGLEDRVALTIFREEDDKFQIEKRLALRLSIRPGHEWGCTWRPLWNLLSASCNSSSRLMPYCSPVTKTQFKPLRVMEDMTLIGHHGLVASQQVVKLHLQGELLHVVATILWMPFTCIWPILWHIANNHIYTYV